MGVSTMKHFAVDLNSATYVGIDCHPTEHTAIAVNRFEEEKGRLTFDNSWNGIQQFLSWLHTIDPVSKNVLIGLEGRGGKGSGFIASILAEYEYVYEVNPQYTRQRRQFGTKGGKSDIRDARCITEVVIRKLGELPLITKGQITSRMLLLKKLVWYYEEETKFGTKLRNHLRQLRREQMLSSDPEEKKLITRIITEKQKEHGRILQKQKRLEVKFSALLKGHEEHLTSIPGVAHVLAAKIIAHSDDMDRFATIAKYLQFAGIAPLEKASGKTKRAVQNHKGNRALNNTFYIAALCQITNNPKAREYYRKKQSEGKTKKHEVDPIVKTSLRTK
jgi:transposase